MTRLSLASPIVHPGDRIGVKVFERPDLSQTLTVDSRGFITMPLAGVISVTGLDPNSVAAKIKAHLVPYMRYPAVEVAITGESSVVFISGGPIGSIAYQPGLALTAAVSQIKADTAQFKAGEQIDLLHSRIDLQKVAILRDGRTLGTYDTVALASRGDEGPLVAAGDTILLVNKPTQVRVDGDVTFPGTTYLDTTEPLSDAIAQLGGLTSTSATAKVAVTRDGTRELHGLGDPIFKAAAHAGDVVSIPTAPRITMTGMVATPGPVVLKTDFSLLSALYNAGGPNKYANLKIVQVVHNSHATQYDITKLTHGDISQNPTLSDGDTVFVPEGHRIDFSLITSTLFGAIYAARSVAP